MNTSTKAFICLAMIPMILSVLIIDLAISDYDNGVIIHITLVEDGFKYEIQTDNNGIVYVIRSIESFHLLNNGEQVTVKQNIIGRWSIMRM